MKNKNKHHYPSSPVKFILDSYGLIRILLHSNDYFYQVTTCREEFRDIPGHTMCMPDNVNVSPEQWGVSETEKNDIVKQHNMLRGSIEPPAADLLAMVRVYTLLRSDLFLRYTMSPL